MNEERQQSPDELDDAALRGLAARLGTGAAARVDVERVARGVVDGLRRPTVVSIPRRVLRVLPAWARLAAALVLLAGAAVVARSALTRPTTPTQFVSADLAGLDADELSDLLRTLDQTLREPRDGAPGSLDELDADQLDQLLQGLEG